VCSRSKEMHYFFIVVLLQLYGAATATAWFTLCASVVLGFFIICLLLRAGSWLDYLDEIYLRKVGWVFSPFGLFPR
jgi:hypothetical protein